MTIAHHGPAIARGMHALVAGARPGRQAFELDGSLLIELREPGARLRFLSIEGRRAAGVSVLGGLQSLLERRPPGGERVLLFHALEHARLEIGAPRACTP